MNHYCTLLTHVVFFNNYILITSNKVKTGKKKKRSLAWVISSPGFWRREVGAMSSILFSSRMFSAAEMVLDREGSTFTRIRGQRRGQARREGQGLVSTRWDGLRQNRCRRARVRSSRGRGRLRADSEEAPRWDPRPVLSLFKRVCHLQKMVA